MRRRDFIALLSSAAATWPLAARAQQSERVRRIGVLTPTSSDNPGQHARIEAFRNALEALGWSVGRNLQVDVRWAAGDVDLLRLVAAAPDVILAVTDSAVAPLRQATRTLPVVFVTAIDPVGSGRRREFGAPGGQRYGLLALRARHQNGWSC